MAYAPLVAMVAAGAVSAGVGVGVAAADTDPRVKTDGTDLYVFAMDDGHGGKKLMVTPEDGHDDVDMTAYGETC